MKPNICRNGHDKDVVGSEQGNRCAECRRQRQRKGRGGPREIKTHCVHGHERKVVGVAKNGTCLECKRAYHRRWSKKYWEKRSRESPNSRREARYLPKLRATRRELGLSTRELSHLTGIDESTINKYERGESKCRPQNLRKLLPVIAQRMRERKWERVA
jgi:ribosome-binding protein aMBF1 (putative translation factor)